MIYCISRFRPSNVVGVAPAPSSRWNYLATALPPISRLHRTWSSAIVLSFINKRFEITLQLFSLFKMIFSSLLQRKTCYETTSVEHIWIEPIVLAPSSSSNSVPNEKEDHFDFDSKRIMNNGHGVYWIEENYNCNDDNLSTLPGAVRMCVLISKIKAR